MSTEHLSTISLKEHSCLRCSQRKVRCDRNEPCANCKKSQAECVFAAPAPRRRRKRKIPEEDLLVRLQQYEELMRSHGVIFDPYDGSERTGYGSAGPTTSVTEGGHIKKEVSPNLQVGKLISERGSSRYIDNNLWTGLSDELTPVNPEFGHQFRGPNDLLHDSSDEERSVTANQRAPGSANPDEADLLFGLPFTTIDLIELHPQPVHIFRLWQTFLDNVNPLTKIIHAPTMQQQILDAASDLVKVSKGLESLMFAIYHFAVTSSSSDYCESTFGEAKSTLLARYRFGTQRALIRVGYLRSSELVVLQAFVLFLLSIRQFCDHRSLWALTGVSVRIGQRLGLHRDGISLGLPIFETELRRRLWWQIVLLDNRSAELSGSGMSVLAHLWDTKHPSSVNDSDLSPYMREPPAEQHNGLTEMAFCMLREEMGRFMQHPDSTRTFDNQNSDHIASSLAEKDKVVDKLQNILEVKFLRFCDPTVPLHVLVVCVAKVSICKLRLIAHHPRQYADPTSIPQKERDLLFRNNLQMIEQDNICHSNKLTQRFLWHINVYFQIEALVYLLTELRQRTLGESVDRAWQQIDEAFEHHPDMLSDRKNPLFSAIQNLTIKAWQAHEMEYMRQNQGLGLRPSPLISTLLSTNVATHATISSTMSSPIAPFPQRVNENSQVGGAHSNTESLFGDTSHGFGVTAFSDFWQTDLNGTDWAYWDDLLRGSDLQAFNT